MARFLFFFFSFFLILFSFSECFIFFAEKRQQHSKETHLLMRVSAPHLHATERRTRLTIAPLMCCSWASVLAKCAGFECFSSAFNPTLFALRSLDHLQTQPRFDSCHLFVCVCVLFFCFFTPQIETVGMKKPC